MTTTVSEERRVQLTRPFGELGRADVAYAGGKGANLGELTRAGFAVPAGFVVGAPAYASFTATGRCASASRSGSPRWTSTMPPRCSAPRRRSARS